nr:hypothetical protein [Brucella intermedia]
MANLLYNNYASMLAICKVDVDLTFPQLADQGLDIGISIPLVARAKGVQH